jgi:hypothetical protein
MPMKNPPHPGLSVRHDCNRACPRSDPELVRGFLVKGFGKRLRCLLLLAADFRDAARPQLGRET